MALRVVNKFGINGKLNESFDALFFVWLNNQRCSGARIHNIFK
jgi:hypothetical protein